MPYDIEKSIAELCLIAPHDLSVFDMSFLEKSINNRCNFLGIKSQKNYLNSLKIDSNELSHFCQSMFVNYSEFFRNPLTFDALEQRIIPAIIKSNTNSKEIRVWSAGCSCGQEAYSIAIIFEKLKSKNFPNLRYRIIATDVSKSDLNYAINGEYTEDQIANIKYEYVKDYFVHSGDKYIICDKIKENVFFSCYDLLDKSSTNPPESVFGDFNIIFCNNLLFYYNDEVQKQILQKLYNSMATNGYFVTGEAEKLPVLKNLDVDMITQPCTIFQKTR